MSVVVLRRRAISAHWRTLFAAFYVDKLLASAIARAGFGVCLYAFCPGLIVAFFAPFSHMPSVNHTHRTSKGTTNVSKATAISPLDGIHLRQLSLPHFGIAGLGTTGRQPSRFTSCHNDNRRKTTSAAGS
jgi:hypothetical protein